MRRGRFISAILATLIFVSLFSACGKKEIVLDNKIVRAEDPWYETTRFNVGYETAQNEMIESQYIEYCSDKVYVADIIYNLETYDRSSYLLVYDDSGNQLNQIPIDTQNGSQISMILSIVPDPKGNNATVFCDVFGLGTGFAFCSAKLDLGSGKMSDITPLTDLDGNLLSSDYGISGVYNCDDYTVVAHQNGLDNDLYIYEGNKCISKMDHSGVDSIFILEQCVYNSSSKKISASSLSEDQSEMFFFDIDPKTGKVSDVTYSALADVEDNNITDYNCTSNGDYLKVDSLGNIFRFDSKKGQSEIAIDNNWYSPFFSDYKDETTVLSYSEDKAVLMTEKYNMIGYLFSYENTITILKKADTNPHVDKKVIEISAPLDTYFSEYLSDAIFNFNRTDNEYLIRVWGKYNTGVKSGRKISSLDQEAEKLYTLIQELNGSEAPDLVIDLQRSSAMNDELLLDISDFLDQDVRKRQFENIIDASKTNGRSYFLPVIIEIEGLEVRTNDIPSDCKGMNFADFDNFVQEKLSGFSPYDYPDSIYFNKRGFFLSCIDVNSALGDTVDFDSEQFREAASYAKDNFFDIDYVPSKIEMDDLMTEKSDMAVPDARYVKLKGFIDFVHSMKSDKDDYTLIGTPSVDESGLRFNVLESISVASSTDMEDGCRKFINYLFNGSFAENSGSFSDIICTNKAVMEYYLPMTIEVINQAYSKDINSNIVSMSDMNYFGFKEADEKMADEFIKCLSNVTRYNYADPDIVLIIDEEMAPYYAGDRSIDDVIQYLNDRVGKYLSEMN